MPNQQSLYALCGEGVRELSRSPEEWLGFLRTACRNYRCPFPEQLLVYKQRPEATAVLELERWNALFGRWVSPPTRMLKTTPTPWSAERFTTAKIPL